MFNNKLFVTLNTIHNSQFTMHKAKTMQNAQGIMHNAIMHKAHVKIIGSYTKTTEQGKIYTGIVKSTDITITVI